MLPLLTTAAVNSPAAVAEPTITPTETAEMVRLSMTMFATEEPLLTTEIAPLVRCAASSSAVPFASATATAMFALMETHPADAEKMNASAMEWNATSRSSVPVPVSVNEPNMPPVVSFVVFCSEVTETVAAEAVPEGRLTIASCSLRITAMADGDSDALESLCRDGLYRHRSGRLQMRAVKLYADGALGSRGAAMLEDYSDDHGNRGLMVMSPAQLATAVAKAKRCGVQAATHAIGDRGNRETLDLYAKALAADAAGDHRWRIEHAQVLAPQDLPRLAGLHVIASMQPTHATSDMPWAQDRVGPERIVGAYAWRQLRDSGARLALGSDFPVERVDPRLGLASAVTRADADGLPVGGWYPNEKLTAYEALRGFTLDAAYAGFAEAEVGSLQAGKRADFVVLAEDPLAVPGAELRALTVLATYVDGKPVYEATGNGSAAAP